jgi:hypothetical protein
MTKLNLPTTVVLLTVLWVAPGSVAAAEMEIVRGGQAAASIVVAAEASDWLTSHAAQNLRAVVQAWTGVEVPVITWMPGRGTLPSGPLLILAEAGSLGRLPSGTSREAFEQAQLVSEGGFACQPGEIDGRPTYFAVGKTNRGLFNAAQYIRDFLLDGSKENLKLDTQKVLRSPQSGGRPVYLLTIWGQEAEYSVADWEKIFDSFARDGFDRVYFWLSGHFPSQKYPQTYKVKDDRLDTTEKSRIGTLEDQRRLIRAAHERGLKFYLGGAMGGWVGTRFLTNLDPETMKTPLPNGPWEGKYSLCPSHPKSRKALIEYYTEMFDALPEADGVYLESADEWGECACDRCSRPVDQAGSRYFGQAQLSLLQEVASSIWRRHPHARFCYTIGYDQHTNDPAYYAVVRQMRDPRFEWMEARNSWLFPSYLGKALPVPYFTRRAMRWQQYYARPLKQIVDDGARVAADGWYGLITAFEPGAGTGSFYNQIPYPTDTIPYIVTYFVFRETCWDAPTTVDQMLDRVYARFFGKEAPRQMAKALWDLRETMLAASVSRIDATKKKEVLQNLSDIEQALKQATTNAGPKTLETIGLMQKAITDARDHLAVLLKRPGEGKLIVRVTENGRNVACRLRVKGPLPEGRTVFHGIGDGHFELTTVSGAFRVSARRGPEYRNSTQDVRVEEGQTKEVELRLVRLTDMTQYGWWSGDTHVHLDPAAVKLHMAAEDVHVVPLLTWWNEHQQELPPPGEDYLVEVSPQRLCHLGSHEHEPFGRLTGTSALFFNLHRPVPYDENLVAAAERAKREQGWVEIEKPYVWDTPALLAGGQVDSVEIAPNILSWWLADDFKSYTELGWGRPRDSDKYPGLKGYGLYVQDLYYRILNCGFRISPTAGTACGVRHVPFGLGYNRVYVHLSSAFSWAAWWEGLAAGRAFVTNGPLLQVEANDALPGEVFRSRNGQPVRIQLNVRLEGEDPIESVEVIKNGTTVQRAAGPDSRGHVLLDPVCFGRSGWFLIRAITTATDTLCFASTAPFYVEIGTTPRTVSSEDARFLLNWAKERYSQVSSVYEGDARREDFLLPHRRAVTFFEALCRNNTQVASERVEGTRGAR